MDNKTEILKNKKGSNINLKQILPIIAILAVIVIIVLVVKVFLLNKTDSTKDVNKILTDKETAVIYIENTDEKECKYCKNVKDKLEKEKIDYVEYDLNKVSDKDYKALLKKLDIDATLINPPAVIYIRDGKMYANIINIEDTKVVTQFIKDYELNK